MGGIKLVKKRRKDVSERQKLKDLLKDRDVEVRRDAVYSLRKLKDISLETTLLIKSLEDEDWRVRKSAIDVLLDDIKNKVVIKALSDTLCSENANARNSAVEALTALGSEATDYLIEAFECPSSDVRKFIIDILGTTGDLKALPLLLKALKDKDENIQASAAEHLGNFQDISAINALISVLKSGDMWLCYHAADALGRIGDNRAVDALISILPRKDMRKPAIRALGQIAEISSLSSIAPFLKDESETICEETIKAVEKFFHKGVPEKAIVKTIKKSFGDNAVNILWPYACSDKKEVKTAAVFLSALLKDKRAIAPLLEISLSEETQETAIKALVFIANASPECLIPFFNISDTYQRRIICGIAGSIGAAVFLNPFVNLLKDEDGHVRANSMIALSRLNNPKAIKYIKPLLLDEYEDIQETAIKTLSILKRGLDLDGIITDLSDRNPVLRKNSARLLGLIGKKAAIEALGVAFKDSEVSVRAAVVEAIGSIGGHKAVKYLLLALTDESPKVRRVAAFAISNMHTRKSVDFLILLLSDSDVLVKATAAKGLGRIKDRNAVEPLIKLLSDESGVVRTAAIEALGNFKEDGVKNVLLNLLTDEDAEVRSTSVASLSVFEGIVQDIMPLLKDENWAVRKRVVDVIGKLFRDKSYSYLKEIAETDNDDGVREAAAGYLSV